MIEVFPGVDRRPEAQKTHDGHTELLPQALNVRELNQEIRGDVQLARGIQRLKRNNGLIEVAHGPTKLLPQTRETMHSIPRGNEGGFPVSVRDLRVNDAYFQSAQIAGLRIVGIRRNNSEHSASGCCGIDEVRTQQLQHVAVTESGLLQEHRNSLQHHVPICALGWIGQIISSLFEAPEIPRAGWNRVFWIGWATGSDACDDVGFLLG